MPPKVLILNHSNDRCGVYQFGKRVYELVENSNEVSYIYRELEDFNTYSILVEQIKPDYIVYNWHPLTMGWLSENIIVKDKIHKHCFIWHDDNMRQNYDKYLMFGTDDKDHCRVQEGKGTVLPRPLLVYNGKYPKNKILTIGSFGFGYLGKGAQELVRVVSSSEDIDKAVLNLHLPVSHYGDAQGIQANEVISLCRKYNDDSRIQLNISQEFKTNDGVLEFLAKNDINIFLYKVNCDGLSSTIDYALSVKRPVAISRSNMFRHIQEDSILIDKNSITEIVKRGIEPLKKYYSKWSVENFREEFDMVFKNE